MSHACSPELEAAFLQWLDQQDEQVRAAITLTPDDPDSAFTISHGAIRLEASLEDRGIDIYAERHGECWDILISFVVAAEPTEGGYHCMACIWGHRRVFPDLDRLWRNHLFGPLLGWMRRRLFRADRLCFYSAPGAWWVKLLRPGDAAGNPDKTVEAGVATSRG